MNLYEDTCGYFSELKSNIDILLFPNIDTIRECYDEDDIDDRISNEYLQRNLFTGYTQLGYRRAGEYIYKNVCPSCLRCQSIRIPVKTFLPSKSQRRVFRINQDIEILPCMDSKDFITEEKIQLYRLYSLKHNREMFTREKAIEDLLYWNGMSILDNSTNYASTRNLDYYLGEKLVGCSVIDELEDGFSSVYFYYDTSSEIMKRSLGTFSVLWEIKQLQMLDAEYYYLGYYIKSHKDMDYKANFKPFELLSSDGVWKEPL